MGFHRKTGYLVCLAAAHLAYSVGWRATPALAQDPDYSAFVASAAALRDAAHSGVVHIVVTDHCDFTQLDMSGWWYHVKPAKSMETIQGDCGTPQPAVPMGTVALRRLKPRQCVILHDANLLGFVALSPTHHWLSNLYLRLVRTNRDAHPAVLTLHDSAWAFLDALTFQGDGTEDGEYLALSVSPEERVYMKECEFIDLACFGCPAVADVAGIVDFEYSVFNNIQMGPRIDPQGDGNNAAIYLRAYGNHPKHKPGVPPPTVRLELNTFTNIQPYGILAGHSAELASIVYTDAAGGEVTGPNTTVGSLGEARGIFLQDQHDWYTSEREKALAVKRTGGNIPPNGNAPPDQDPLGEQDKLESDAGLEDSDVERSSPDGDSRRVPTMLVLLYVLAAVVAVAGTGFLVWLIITRVRQHRTLLRESDEQADADQKPRFESVHSPHSSGSGSRIQMQPQPAPPRSLMPPRTVPMFPAATGSHIHYYTNLSPISQKPEPSESAYGTSAYGTVYSTNTSTESPSSTLRTLHSVRSGTQR